MIPNETIEKILDKTDIVEVVNGFVPLKKSGQNFKACCPFHEEKTASFMVSPAKQIFHCFGCGAGGNVISFLMKHERMDFIEVIKMLADKASVSLPRFATGDKEKNTFAEKLYNANNLACNFYEENLTREYNKKAYEYFINRGLHEKTIRHFRLGFAPEAWQGLIGYCKPKGVEPDILEKAGLVLRNAESGNQYDRFRNRIMFPIFDMRNRVMAFGGRGMDKDAMPKYVNSPETHIYVKGRQLYGLNLSRDYIRKQDYVIIVEGYFDLILPFQNEIRNIVATLGTALTVDQISAIKRFTKNVIMIYDSDKAGEAATLRSLDLLLEEEMNVRIAVLPSGSDPDSFVRKEGKAGFVNALKTSKDLFDYKLGTLTAKFKKTSPHGKAKIVEEMLPTLVKIKNAVLRSSYLRKMSEALAVDEESIRTELKELKPDSRPAYSAKPKLKTAVKKIHRFPAEITVLAMALEDADIVQRIETDPGFGKFRDERIGAIFNKICEFCKNGKKVNPSHLISYFEDETAEEIISEALSIGQTVQDKERVLEDCFRHIRRDNLKESLKDIHLKIKAAQDAADTETVNALIAKYDALIKNGLGDRA